MLEQQRYRCGTRRFGWHRLGWHRLDRSRRVRLLPAVALLPVAFLFAGCSTSGLAVSSMTPVLENTVAVALRSDDPRLIGDALPTSLLLVDGMLETSPGNRDLAELGALLNFAYAFAFLEAEQPARASRFYDHGRELGWQALNRPDFERTVREGSFDELHRALAGSVREGDRDALLWVCANWGMWIQLNLQEPRAAADLARLMPLAEKLAEADDTLFWGMPRILLGALQAGRPVMLGGNLDRAREEFERAFEISDRNLLLAQVFFAKTWCVQSFDAEAFDSTLREVLDAPHGQLPDAELLNRIARIQAESLLARAEDIFE